MKIVPHGHKCTNISCTYMYGFKLKTIEYIMSILFTKYIGLI